MFESIQDYFCKEIDKEKLIENLILCDEYREASKDVKEKLDLFIEDIKEVEDREQIEELLSSNYLYDLGIQPDSFKLLDLATRTSGGMVPVLEPGQLAAFIDLCIEHEDDERIFRLAYNYNPMLFDKSRIEDYFIDKKNYFYLNEMACNNLDGVHYDKIMEAMLKCDQVDELKYFATNVSDKELNVKKIVERIKELGNK